jgi:hypothetical protein
MDDPRKVLEKSRVDFRVSGAQLLVDLVQDLSVQLVILPSEDSTA